MNTFLVYRNKLTLLKRNVNVIKNNSITLNLFVQKRLHSLNFTSGFIKSLYSIKRKAFCNKTEKKKLIETFDIEDLNHKGVKLMTEGKLVEALEVFKQTLVINVNYYKAYNNMGLINQQMGNTSEAIENFKQVIEINSEALEGYVNLGNLYSYINRYDESVGIFKKGLEQDIPKKNKVFLYKGLGCCYSHMKLYDKSLDCFEKAIVLEPEYDTLYNDYGTVLMYMGKPKEAIDKYNKCIEINPQNAEAMNNKGMALNSLGRIEEAIKTCEKAYSINPNIFEINMGLGFLYSEKKDYQKSIRFYRNVAEKIKPNDRKIWFLLGTNYYHTARYNEAIDSFIKHAELFPEDKKVIENNIEVCKKERDGSL